MKLKKKEQRIPLLKSKPQSEKYDIKFSGSSVSYPDELCESVVDVGTTGQEEAAAGTQIMEEKQLLILWQNYMTKHHS